MVWEWYRKLWEDRLNRLAAYLKKLREGGDRDAGDKEG